MPRAFARINFTPSVKAAQSAYRSREANRGFELAEDDRTELSDYEAEFIHARDSFYQATVNQFGWPYVQHRGGAAGFLRVLDQHTLGFADFSGNRQYLSVGNLLANDKIAMILMDYKNRRRLKIWGRVRIVHEADEPELIARLEVNSYRARIERAFIITVEAFDWNCPQHITRRYTEAEVAQLLAAQQSEIEQLKKQLNSQQKISAAPIGELGQGPLSLVVSGVRQLSPGIKAIQLSPADGANGAELPAIQAGAHLSLPVILADGKPGLRHYSISSSAQRRDHYEIAVQLQESGRGGSAFVHQHYLPGLKLHCRLPENYFVLAANQRPVLLIAAGIGITPIMAMARELLATSRAFSLHYVARSKAEMAYHAELKNLLGERFHAYFSRQHKPLDLAGLLQQTDRDTELYCCGPAAMLKQFQQLGQQLGFAAERLHDENFSALLHAENHVFQVVLHKSKQTLQVAADQTLQHALEQAGIDAAFSCGTGQCGTCAVKLIAGEAEHRDHVLNDQQRQQEHLFCPCVSRAKGASITLDL